MTGWTLVEVVASRLLERNECEAVLGDLAETGESTWAAMLDVMGLAFRRKATPWRTLGPWVAAFGLALPCSLLLMGLSVSISATYLRLFNTTVLKNTGFTLGPGIALLLWNVILLIGWASTGGFVMGSISRKTIRISVLMSSVPCVFCMARFHVESLSRFCLLLFLIPAAWGVYRGLRLTRIYLPAALVLALGITLLTIPMWRNPGAWLPNWALSWPAWYLVLTAWRSSRRAEGARQLAT